jgi:putative tricarboxylic transport membrane protein
VGLLEEPKDIDASNATRLSTGSIWSAIPGMLGYWKTWLRSAIIGIFVGILPGAGGSMAAFLSWNEARRASSNPDEWGHGEPEGVAAAETANNADTASAMIPALTLGIPGTAVAAVMLGGLLIHGLQPGPMLFRSNPEIVFGFMWQFLFAAILLIFLGGSLATNSFAQVLRLPRPILGAIIIALVFIGVYSINGRMFDVYLTLGFGVIGYFMEKLKFPLPPVVLGLILGKFAEENLRLALRIGRGDWSVLWSSTTSLIIIGLTLIVVLMPILRQQVAKRRAARQP